MHSTSCIQHSTISQYLYLVFKTFKMTRDSRYWYVLKQSFLADRSHFSVDSIQLQNELRVEVSSLRPASKKKFRRVCLGVPPVLISIYYMLSVPRTSKTLYSLFSRKSTHSCCEIFGMVVSTFMQWQDKILCTALRVFLL